MLKPDKRNRKILIQALKNLHFTTNYSIGSQKLYYAVTWFGINMATEFSLVS